jgi:hypothetical protein
MEQPRRSSLRVQNSMVLVFGVGLDTRISPIEEGTSLRCRLQAAFYLTTMRIDSAIRRVSADGVIFWSRGEGESGWEFAAELGGFRQKTCRIRPVPFENWPDGTHSRNRLTRLFLKIFAS